MAAQQSCRSPQLFGTGSISPKVYGCRRALGIEEETAGATAEESNEPLNVTDLECEEVCAMPAKEIRRSSSRSASVKSRSDKTPQSNINVEPITPNPVILPSGNEVIAEGNALTTIMESIRNLESKVLALQTNVQKCSDSDSVVEGASNRSYSAYRLRPLSDSQDIGNGHVVSRRRVTGTKHRSGVPSAVPEDDSQAAKDRARARILKECFSSSETSSPQRGWVSRRTSQDESGKDVSCRTGGHRRSRPLKRGFREEDVLSEDRERPHTRLPLSSSPEDFEDAIPQKRVRTSGEKEVVLFSNLPEISPERKKRASPRPSSFHWISPSYESSPV
ncbi:uncharacterized protein LOC135220013 [Macrobrachium nipponense]|uniref:uncharacterized protein LOC135220013 n=1 Tax=Macrobrachium nipponense TaxID=159736 RepID=UPI0030C86EEB